MSVIIPEGEVAVDTSVLVELVEGTAKGKATLEAVIDHRLTPHASWLNVAEAEYIVCRKIGHERARSSIEALLDSGYLVIEEDPSIHKVAAGIKCGRSISMVDCYTFAVAELAAAIPLFASQEAEIVREAKKRAFKTPPVFLS